MIKSKVLRISIVSLLFVVAIYLALNLVLASFYQPILNRINNEHLEIKIGEINKLLFPFYIDVDEVSVKVDNTSIELNKLSVSMSLKKLLSGKPFVTTYIKGLNVDSDIEISSTNSDVDYSKYLSYIKKFDLVQSDINLRYEGFEAKFFIEKFRFRDSNKEYILIADNSYIKRGELKENFTADIKGILSKDKLQIINMDILGSSVFIKSNHFVVSKSDIEGDINGSIGEKFLKIINPELTGSINFKTKVKNDILTLAFQTENMSFQKEKISVKGRAKGNIFKKIDFDIDELKLLDYSFKIKGNYDVETTYLYTDIFFLKTLDIYKGYGWHVYIKDAFIRGKVKDNNLSVKTFITSEDTYKVTFNAEFDKDKKIVKLNNLKGVSKNSTLSGSAVSNFKGIIIKGKGHVKNNAEVVKILNLKHEADVTLFFDVDFDHLILKGTYSSNIPQKLYNVQVKSFKGTYDLNYDRVLFTTNAMVDEGTLDIDGIVDFNTGGSDFVFDYDRVYFSSILDYFELETKMDIPIEGKAFLTLDKNHNATATGDVRAVSKDLPYNEVSFSLNNNVFYIDNMRIDKYRFSSTFSLNLKTKAVKGKIHAKDFSLYKIPELKTLDINLKGKFDKPDLYGYFQIDTEQMGLLEVKFKGDFDNINFYLNREGLKLVSKINIKKKLLTTNINFADFKITKDKNTSITGNIKIKSDDFEKFKGCSKSIILIYDGLVVDFHNISFHGDKTGIKRLTALSRGAYWNKLVLKDFKVNKDGVTGVLDFDETKVNFDYGLLNTSGEVNISYDFKNDINLNGRIDLKGNASLHEYGIRIPINEGYVKFDGTSVESKISGSELDMSYNFEYKTENYLNYLDGNAKLNAKDIYLRINSTSMLVDIDANYSNRLLKADIYLIELAFDASKSKFNSGNTDESKLDLPFDMEINFKTKDNLHLKTDFYDSTIAMNFMIKYDSKTKDLKLKGKFESVKSKIRLAGTTFYVRKAYVNFSESLPPYIYVDLQGSGQQSSVNIKIYGFLTDYKIELIDRNPNNSNFIQANASSAQSDNDKSLMLNLMNGVLSERLLNTSERLFGINRLGLEENMYHGENSNYVKVGKMFSDRLEVKYMIATGRDDTNTIAAEYLLLDWLKIVIYSAADGGNGAGFTFILNF